MSFFWSVCIVAQELFSKPLSELEMKCGEASGLSGGQDITACCLFRDCTGWMAHVQRLDDPEVEMEGKGEEAVETRAEGGKASGAGAEDAGTTSSAPSSKVAQIKSNQGATHVESIQIKSNQI